MFLLLKKPAEDLGEENIKKSRGKFKKRTILYGGLFNSIRQMKKMGGIEGIMSFMPGVSKMKSQMDASGI